MPTWQWSSFQELSNYTLYALMKLRQDVFIIEQDCIYPDLDDYDQNAWHLLGWEFDGESNALVAYARLLAPGVKYAEPSIGRVITTKSQRGKGTGKALMQSMIQHCQSTYPGQGIRISGQQYLERFYHELGFETVSDMYLEDDIPHIEMLLKANG